MILADTSAWMDYDGATKSAADRALEQLISAGGGELAVTEPVLVEVLAGAKDEKRGTDLRRLPTSFQWIAVDPVADFEAAAKIYRDCRAGGVAPRGLIDGMIAAVAMRTGSTLLAADRDFTDMATVVPLRLAE